MIILNNKLIRFLSLLSVLKSIPILSENQINQDISKLFESHANLLNVINNSNFVDFKASTNKSEIP